LRIFLQISIIIRNFAAD